MLIIAISDSFEEEIFGPYTDPALAQIVLGIVKEAVDEDAELRTIESDQYARQLKAGLRPYKICVELDASGKVVNKEVVLTWPPHEEEGLYDDREFYKEYFVWADSTSRAISRLAIANRRPP
jgi:hypothetical protein